MYGLLHRIKLLDRENNFATTVIPMRNGMYRVLERTEFGRIRYPGTITNGEGLIAYCEENGLHRADIEQATIFDY